MPKHLSGGDPFVLVRFEAAVDEVDECPRCPLDESRGTIPILPGHCLFGLPGRIFLRREGKVEGEHLTATGERYGVS
jgi:hypothetical protein